MNEHYAAAISELSPKITGILRAMSSSMTQDELFQIAVSRDLSELEAVVDRGYALIAEAALAAFLSSLTSIDSSVHRQLVADTTGWRIQDAQARLRAGLISTLANAQKELLRLVMADVHNTPASMIAVRLRNALGLAEGDYSHVDRQERLMAVPTRREIQQKETAVSWQQVAVITATQARSRRDRRAENMAGIEGRRAVNRAELEAWNQAADRRLVGRGSVRRVWNCAMRNSRDSHAATDGQERGLDDPFDLGSGRRAMHPGDPGLPVAEVAGCNCWLTYRLGV